MQVTKFAANEPHVDLQLTQLIVGQHQPHWLPINGIIDKISYSIDWRFDSGESKAVW